VIDWLNANLFNKFYRKRFHGILEASIQKQASSFYEYRILTYSDIPSLNLLLKKLEPSQLTYFEPHEFDLKSLENIFHNPSFFRMGVFFNNQLVGYFFLRCFANKKCFVGRLVDKNHRGKGIGKAMNEIMYNTAWNAGFRCFATISKNNELVMNAHAKNPNMVVRKELDDNYLLVEFLKEKSIIP